MACCGRAGNMPRFSSPAAAMRPVSRLAATRPAAAPVAFEYAGPGAIAVTGPLTGTAYKFSGAGSRIIVHAADVASLLGVPGLKPVR